MEKFLDIIAYIVLWTVVPAMVLGLLGSMWLISPVGVYVVLGFIASMWATHRVCI